MGLFEKYSCKKCMGLVHWFRTEPRDDHPGATHVAKCLCGIAAYGKGHNEALDRWLELQTEKGE
jgi:hypothetical protein